MQKQHCTPLVESLERRSMFSASMDTLIVDAEDLDSYIIVEVPQDNATRAEMFSAVPAGTKGRGPLSKALIQFINDLQSAGNLISSDAYNLPNDAAAGTSFYNAGVANLTKDVATERATLKVDFSAIAMIESKHPNLATINTTVASDLSGFHVSWTNEKFLFKQIKTDLQ